MTNPSDPGAEAAAGGRIERAFGSTRFFALWIVQVASALGDWVGFFAITALAASISDRPEAAIALVTGARILPGLFFAPFVGVLIDRIDKKRVMITADIVRAIVFLFLPFVQTIGGLVVASLLLEVFTMAWSPAKESIVPRVVPKDRLTQANSLSLVAAYATMPIAGPIQFGLRRLSDGMADITWLGFLQLNRQVGETQALAFYFNSVSFLFAAFVLWRFVFRGLDTAPVTTGQVPVVETDADDLTVLAMHEERSYLRRLWDEIREGWEFIFVNPVVRAVNIGLATGLIGGAMLIPLGPIFARSVIGDPDTFALFITALGLGVATGVVTVSALQNRLPKEKVFPFLVFGAGVSLFLGVSMSNFWAAAAGVMGLGFCAGAVYVLGFTLLQEHTDDALRGRIFTALLTVVRMCVLLALFMGPVLATMFDGLVRTAMNTPPNEVPTLDVGVGIAVPGARITLWLASLIICFAGILAARSMQLGIREQIRTVRNGRNGNGNPEVSS